MVERKNLDYDEYKKLQIRAEAIAIKLMKHEGKDYAKVKFPQINYRKIRIDNRDFYYSGTNIFLGIIEIFLVEAVNKFPLNFGNGNALSVLRALNLTRFLSSRLCDAIRIYQNENFIWVYDNIEEKKENKILRLDLFRKLDKVRHVKRKKEFTGGIFHALKHFSFFGKSLSTGKDSNNLRHPEEIIFLIIKAFYLSEGTFINENSYVTLIRLNDKYDLKFIFYYESKTNVYFITTIHKIKRKNNI